MPTAAPAETILTGHPTPPGAPPVRSGGALAYEGGYANRALLKWLLNDDFLSAALPWWRQFMGQQAEIREFYRAVAPRAQFTGSRNISKGGLFFHMCRIPINIAEIMCACDYELDGRNEPKLELFLKDFPLYDLRVVTR